MKKVLALILAFSMTLVLCACCLSHDWQEATCTEPKTCSKCGKTEGEALGHKWEEATCTKPKTCSVCGATEGKALGHKAGEATCTEPSVCSVCGATEGTALGHQWKDATVRNPKTCERCGETEGEPLILFYWNEPVDLGSGYTACFYDDNNGHYRFEVSNPNQSSATILMMLENKVFKDYGIGSTIYNWMKHIMDEYREFDQKGKMVYYSLNGLGNINIFYFNYGDIDSGKNGLVGLEWNYSWDSIYDGTIGRR